MKRFFSLLAALLLVLQMILPQLVTAQTTTDTKDVEGVTLLDIVMEKGADSTDNYRLSGHMVNHSNEAKEAEIKVSDNVRMKLLNEKHILDAEQNILGDFDVKNNTIQFLIPSGTDTDFHFLVAGEYNGDLAQDTVTFSDGVGMISKDVGKKEAAKADTKQAEQPDEKALAAPGPNAASEGPRDIKDIMMLLGYSKKQSVLSDMSVTYTDKDGQVVTEPTVEDSIRFAFDWQISDELGALINAGDYYSFELPDNIKVPKNMTIDLGEYGTATVNTSGKVTFTFTDEVKGSSDVHGTLHFGAGFNGNGIDGPGDTTIKIPNESQLPTMEVTIKPIGGAMIDKSGHFDKVQNPDNVIWNVEINKGLDKLVNARVVEEIPSGLTYEFVKLYTIDVDLKGNVVAGSEKLVTTGYTVDENGNVTFTNPINSAYRLVYNTSINNDKKPLDGGEIKFINNAKLFSDDDTKGISTSATVNATYGKILAKAATGYDSAKQTYDWTVKYNYGEKHIDQVNAIIKDTFGSDRMTLVDGSMELYNVTFDSSGKEILGAPLVAGTDYEIVKTATGFDTHFLHDISGAVVMQYKTGITGTVDGNIGVSNEVSVDSGQRGSGSGTIYQQNLVKKLGAVDYKKKTVAWTIDVNKNHYVMKNWKLTDTLSKGLTLDTDSVQVYDVNGKSNLKKGKDYELVYDLQTNVFTIEFLNDYKAETERQFKISYKTAFDMSQVWDTDDRNFKNSASSTWLDANGKPFGSSSEAVFDPNHAAKNNGFKQGSYNAKTGHITWATGVNYDGTDLGNAKLVDPILGNQQFVPKSVKIYSYAVNANGSIQKGAEAADYSKFTITEPSEKNKNTLTVEFPDGKASMYLVEFDTSVKGQIVSANYQNHAVFKNDTYPDQTLSADVSVKYGDRFALKSGMQDDDGFVNWSVTVNPSLSQIEDVVVTDRPSPNQSIDMDSLVIYGTVVSEDGSLSVNRSTKLILGEDYTLNLTTDNATGQQELKIAFKNELNEAYVIEYRTMVMMTGNTDKVFNNVKINGNHEEKVTGGETTELDVVVSSGGGTAVGIKGSISFQKVNANDEALQGAKFQLWDKTNRVAVREGTMDQNGKITFGSLPYGNYILKEVKAPEGYTVSDELIRGKQFTISKSSSDAKNIEKIVNTQNKVTLTKQDEENQALAGAVFKLQWQVGADWLDIRVDEVFKTNADGRLVIEGLLPANYRLIETTAPQGFIVNPKAIPFVVTQDENGKIPDVSVGPFTNYQGSIEFMKQDEAGNPLTNAEFALQDQDDTVIRTLTTDETGKVSAKNLAPGSYTITETKAPVGFAINTKQLHFTIAAEVDGKPNVQKLDNFINYKGSVSLVKNNENGDLLSGATFKIVDQDGTTVRTDLQTNEAGKVDVTGLAPGTYRFVEVAAPQGYLINETPVEFTITDKSEGKPAEVQTTFTDHQGSFKLQKENTEHEPLAGAVFELRDVDGNVIKTITSGNDGRVEASNIAPGKYTVVEVKAPTGYVLNSYPLELNIPESAPGVPETVDLGEFTNFKGKVALVKEGESGDALEGAEFTIYDTDGKVVDTTIAASNGRIDYGNLAPGYYKIVETKAPNGYIINTNPMYFTILDKYSGKLDSVDVGRIINYQAKVTFKKTDEMHHGLAGATFQLVNQQTGQVLQNDIMSGEDGTVTLTGLQPGEYEIMETKAPQDYILNTTPLKFTVKNEIFGAPEVIELADFVNYQGSAILTKIDSMENVLAGAVFNLMDDQGKIVAENLVSDENGEVRVEQLVPGKYHFIEVEAPAGYEKDETPIPFQIGAKAKDKPEAVQLQFTNNRIPTKIVPVDKQPKPDKGLVVQEHKPKPNKPQDKSEVSSVKPLKSDKLPATGDSQTEPVLFVMMGAVLLAGWFRLHRK
ncbi:celll wall surface anchor family protein [Listeria weihenstephanensis FSL R9-0317]|uniref:SpaA isopeptide-forming pilin-related protein n=1 Tax=Listeria weihenstephanensis TaxID=1006155 RepID=UPI0003E88B8D|nr:SpaA isopeptide-forming pilin-related protein [Listeria weihenstephanensis]EUJ41110.1 celll wall surface anchor family protein [Listeria weihenstephanensis FSL R9-0317]